MKGPILREFPLEFELKKEPHFYPATPEKVCGDILEIGPGNGDFLMELAKKFPDKKIAAIEVREKRFQKISKRLEKSGFQNVVLVWGDARVIIPHYFAEARFEKIYILFPDPWPKHRHAFHRLLDLKFLSQLALCLKKQGELILATDFEEYAEWILNQTRQIPELKQTPFVSDFKETFFERIWKKEGKKIRYLAFTR